MDFRGGLFFWTVGAILILILLLGHPQLLTVEGLECDICQFRFERPGSCRRMPCDSGEDERAAFEVLDHHQKEIEEDDKKEKRMEKILEEEAKNDKKLADRPNWDKIAGRAGQDGRRPKSVCVKALGLKPTKGALDRYNILKTYCLFDPDRKRTSPLPPPGNDPYEDSFFAGTGNEHEFLGFKVYFCDDTIEATCRVTQQDRARKTGPNVSDDDPLRGLMCSVCARLGEAGSKSCKLMPCQKNSDVSAADAVIRSDKGEIDTKLAKGDANKTDSRSAGNDPPFVCVKILGTSSKNGHFILSRCVNRTWDAPPAQDEPYTTYPEGYEEAMKKSGITLEKVYICDESNQASCRVTGEELNRASSSNNGADGRTKTNSQLAPVAGFCLLIFGQLIKYFYVKVPIT